MQNDGSLHDIPARKAGAHSALQSAIGGGGVMGLNYLGSADRARARLIDSTTLSWPPQTSERQSLENDLRLALARRELTLCYQPKIDLKTGLTCGAEALLRWHHPIRGTILPSLFIPVAEESNLILPIGEWVLGEACRQARKWSEAGLFRGTMAVNMSAIQLQQHGFAQRVLAILDATGTDPAQIELELTESALMTDKGSAACALQTLRSEGIRIAIDDFGTGYSSLSYLETFPVDSLKIDRSFVRHISSVGTKKTLVTAIIIMGHTLGLRVVAEGVETAEQLDFITQAGCDECQGFFFSAALTAQMFEERLLLERQVAR